MRIIEQQNGLLVDADTEHFLMQEHTLPVPQEGQNHPEGKILVRWRIAGAMSYHGMWMSLEELDARLKLLQDQFMEMGT